MPAIMDTTINWDSNITKVSVIEEGGIGHEYTRSGEMTTLLANRPYTATVTLNSGYILDSVTTNEDGVTISNITDTTFIFKGITGTGPTITLTSKSNVSKVSIDLTTLTGWDNVSSGEHTIQVVAKATGYLDSAKSTAVSFTKASAKVLLEKGTYQFLERLSLTYDDDVRPFVEETISGKMNSLSANNTYGDVLNFNYITIDCSGGQGNESIDISENVAEDSNNYVVYFGNYDDVNRLWEFYKDDDYLTTTDNSKLRTIVLEENQYVSQEFYNLLITQGNLVKVEETTGETWVLNTNPTLIQSTKQFDISFTSNNNSYTYLKFGEDSIGIAQALYYGTTQVYEDGNNAWTNAAYKTITFDTTPTGDLLTWLQANGTKQGGGATTAHTLTIEEKFSYGDNITVNGNAITSPYTLQNGDVIKVPTTNSTTTINGTSYSISDESVLNINNQDIVISRTGPEKVISPVPYITINYTE